MKGECFRLQSNAFPLFYKYFWKEHQLKFVLSCWSRMSYIWSCKPSVKNERITKWQPPNRTSLKKENLLGLTPVNKLHTQQYKTSIFTSKEKAPQASKVEKNHTFLKKKISDLVCEVVAKSCKILFISILHTKISTHTYELDV